MYGRGSSRPAGTLILTTAFVTASGATAVSGPSARAAAAFSASVGGGFQNFGRLAHSAPAVSGTNSMGTTGWIVPGRGFIQTSVGSGGVGSFFGATGSVEAAGAWDGFS